MDTLQVKAIIAGVCFGIWPILMNRGGLNGNVGSLVFAGIAMIFVLPFALSSLASVSNVKWLTVIIAGTIGGIGLLFFNGMLSKATAKTVSPLFVTMIVVQVAVPVIYHLIMGNSITLTKGAGFILAIIAGVLLSI